jgi:hypothetical protein
MCRVGQNHIYTVYIRYFWQGNHQIYGHIRCIYTVLANPTYVYWGRRVPVVSSAITLSTKKSSSHTFRLQVSIWLPLCARVPGLYLCRPTAAFDEDAKPYPWFNRPTGEPKAEGAGLSRVLRKKCSLVCAMHTLDPQSKFTGQQVVVWSCLVLCVPGICAFEPTLTWLRRSKFVGWSCWPRLLSLGLINLF